MSQDSYNNPRNHHVVCACNSDERTLRLIHFKADPKLGADIDEIYWSVYPNPFPWYKRLWIAMRYVLSHRSKFGSWDSGPTMDADAIEQLRAFLADVDTKRL